MFCRVSTTRCFVQGVHKLDPLINPEHTQDEKILHICFLFEFVFSVPGQLSVFVYLYFAPSQIIVFVYLYSSPGQLIVFVHLYFALGHLSVLVY